MREQIGGGHGSYHARLESFDRDGKLVQHIDASVAFSAPDAQGRRDIRVLAQAPESLAGSAYLVRQRDDRNEVFFHLASQQKTLKISDQQPAEAFGTGLDLHLVNQALLALRQGSITAGGRSRTGPGLRTLYLSLPAQRDAQVMDMAVLGVNPQSCLPETITLEQRLDPISRIELPADSWSGGENRYPGLVRIEQPDSGAWSTLRLEAVTPVATPPGAWFDPARFMRQP